MWGKSVKSAIKRAAKNKTGQITVAKPFENSIVENPANLEDFLYAKNKEGKTNMNEELKKSLARHGMDLETEIEPSAELVEAEQASGATIPVILAKSVDVLDDVEALHTELEKKGVAKAVQRKAMMSAMKKISDDINSFLEKAGYVGQEQSSKEKKTDLKKSDENNNAKSGMEEAEMTPEEIKAFIEKSVKEGIEAAKEVSETPEGAEGKAEAQELEKSELQKLEDRLGQAEAATEVNAELSSENEALKEKNQQLEKSIGSLSKRVEAVCTNLEKMKNTRLGGNSELLGEGEGAKGERTNLKKSGDVFEGSAWGTLPNK